MLFNSYFFLFAFFPVVYLGYWLLQALAHDRTSKAWLVIASLYFYSFFKLSYLPIIVVSICINYFLGTSMLKKHAHRALCVFLLILGCVLNLGILVYYKYLFFFCSNVNYLFGTHLTWGQGIILPLGISFYTFQQLSYVIDCYQKKCKQYNFLDYSLFVTFFPQLIAGPIVLPSEMLPQFDCLRQHHISWDNINDGCFLFACGLFKKCFVADTLAAIVNVGFDTSTTLFFLEAWFTSLAFTLQLYFDFSGYCDMAMGIAKFFGIDLPLNFNSPYKAHDFQDFWRRWHITLGRFMMNYLYIPLGGNRHGFCRTLLNLFCVFVLSGLWHGAGWLFLIWGVLHGFGIIVCRLWHQAREKWQLKFAFPHWLAIAITFITVNFFWVFFRATTLERASSILSSMVHCNGMLKLGKDFRNAIVTASGMSKDQLIAVFFIALISCFALPNSSELLPQLKKHPRWMILLTTLAAFFGFLCVNRQSPFLYFNF